MMTVNIYGKDEICVFTFKNVIKVITTGIHEDKPKIIITKLKNNEIIEKTFDANKYVITKVED